MKKANKYVSLESSQEWGWFWGSMHMFYYSHVRQNVCAVVPIRIGTEAY